MTLERIAELRQDAANADLTPEERAESTQMLDAAEAFILLESSVAHKCPSGRWHSDDRFWPKTPTFAAAVLAALRPKGQS